ncbi:MAG: T9SS type A sorting domain-containing protein [Chitinophagales bacterium]
MKKVYFLLCALAVTCTSFAQTIVYPLNPGFETWRTSSSGSGPVVTIHAPTGWYGFDSLIINAQEQYDGLLYTGYSPTNLNAQVFPETTKVHGGTSSAKIISVKQDTLGIFAGSISNAQPSLNIAALIGGGSIANAITYTGGTATTLRITSVSAWVEYFPGKDSTGAIGVDSGQITLQAIGTYAGADTVVGTGTFRIPPTSSFTLDTAKVVYVDTIHLVNKVRIFFASSGTTGALDSSTLYVDDVSMIGISQTDTINNVTIQNVKNDLVKIYPNPATGIIHLDGPQNAGLVCNLLSVSGQVAATKTLTGSDALDVSYLPAGLYFYTISDTNENIVQRGKIAVYR